MHTDTVTEPDAFAHADADTVGDSDKLRYHAAF